MADGDLKVFVSHSTSEPFAQAVLQAVCDALRAKRCDLLVSARLEPGDVWREKLNQWLAECEAAVLLLSREALRSSWVRREIAILMWRRGNGSRIPVVPVLVGDVAPDDVMTAGYTELRPLQFAVLPRSGHPGELAATIVARLGLDAIRPGVGGHMKRWIDRLSFFLSRVDDVSRLGECARALGVSEEGLRYVTLPGGSRFLAHQMLDDGLSSQTYYAVRAISDYLPHDHLGKLIDNVACAWVDIEAAHKLLDVCQQKAGSTAVLNARHPATADDYLDRATCRGVYWREVAGTVVGEDAVAELVAHYESAVLSLHGVEPPWTVDDIEPRDEPTVLVVDPTGVPLEAAISAVKTVRDRFPWVIVLLLVGDAAPSRQNLDDWKLGTVNVVSPALRPGAERAARRRVRDLRQLLKR